MPKKKSGSFNQTQIKDGWIVRIRKDGTIKAKIERYFNNTTQLKPKSER